MAVFHLDFEVAQSLWYVGRAIHLTLHAADRKDFTQQFRLDQK